MIRYTCSHCWEPMESPGCLEWEGEVCPACRKTTIVLPDALHCMGGLIREFGRSISARLAAQIGDLGGEPSASCDLETAAYLHFLLNLPPRRHGQPAAVVEALDRIATHIAVDLGGRQAAGFIITRTTQYAMIWHNLTGGLTDVVAESMAFLADNLCAAAKFPEDETVCDLPVLQHRHAKALDLRDFLIEHYEELFYPFLQALSWICSRTPDISALPLDQAEALVQEALDLYGPADDEVFSDDTSGGESGRRPGGRSAA
ncbi:MAG: hypothetical protein HZA50_08420 [Planctomycetes bacterium]|nr:hypothetical protein [Planctomycetota bacterium]